VITLFTFSGCIWGSRTIAHSRILQCLALLQQHQDTTASTRQYSRTGASFPVLLRAAAFLPAISEWESIVEAVTNNDVMTQVEEELQESEDEGPVVVEPIVEVPSTKL
jgi:hypothetical protein